MRLFLALAFVCLPVASFAQVTPQADGQNPRMQKVVPIDGQATMLAALPATDLTLVFPASERIGLVEAPAETVAHRITSERNAVVLTPLAEGALGEVRVATDRATYSFSFRTGRDLMAAYVVEVVGAAQAVSTAPARIAEKRQPEQRWWSYEVKGRHSIKPVGIRDDGEKTYILFAPYQLLPAIFAIGPTGEETLTNGYMRGAEYVIDSVWKELVFRLDGRKATARRNQVPDD